jgi:hypothetical protein
MPQGNYRGPFVRVTKPDPPSGNSITVWVGAGWDGYYVTRTTAAEFRSIQTNDWVSFIKTAGIHADMGDMESMVILSRHLSEATAVFLSPTQQFPVDG